MIIVTGVAGFIGMHVAERLLQRGETVLGVDNLDPYYSVALKRARLARLCAHPLFRFEHLDLAEAEATARCFAAANPRLVIHLAAQAGVRHALTHPEAYVRANCAGHLAVLEACRRAPRLGHLVYASSSSVYGERPLDAGGFRETDPVDKPASLYAATKRACELFSQTYAGLYGFPQTGLRFFTVYGPWGRPDMSYFIFTEKILAGRPIEIFGDGAQARDFTYIDDIVDGVLGAAERPPAAGGHRIFNVGRHQPVAVREMLELLEGLLGRSAERIFAPSQPGDVSATCASIEALRALTGYSPRVSLEEGLERFVRWRLGEGALIPELGGAP